MGRAAIFFTVLGPVLILVLIVGGILQHYRKKAGGQQGSFGIDEFGADTGGSGRPGHSLPNIHANFLTLLERVVLPRINAHPDWERLDGAYGVPGHQIAQFAHGDGVYAIKGESRMAALSAVHDWMLQHPGEDPLMIAPMRKGVGRLTIRPEVGWPKADDIRIESV